MEACMFELYTFTDYSMQSKLDLTTCLTNKHAQGLSREKYQNLIGTSRLEMAGLAAADCRYSYVEDVCHTLKI